MHSVLQGFPPDNNLGFWGRGASFHDADSESQQNSTEIESWSLSGTLFSIEEPLGHVVHITKY